MAVLIDDLTNNTTSEPFIMSINSLPIKQNPISFSYQNEKISPQPVPQRRKSSKGVKMSRSFSLSSLKGSNSLESHPLILNQNNIQEQNIESMETDDYDSDDLSCNSSCSSTPSKSNFSFSFDSHHHQPPSSSSFTSIPMEKAPSYSNVSILSSSTGSGISLSMSMGSPSPSTRSYISTSSTTVSCSPITTISIPISATPTTGDSSAGRRRRESICRSSSSDSLYVILKKSTPNSSSPLGNNSNVKSVYSNLTSSLKSFRNKLPFYNKENIINYISDSPRLTDDKLPQVAKTDTETETKTKLDQEVEDVVDSMQELTTFKCSGSNHYHQSNKLGLSRIKYKTREQRANGDFLRLYAFDHNARTKSITLPNNINPDEVKKIMKSHPQWRQFHYEYNIYKISNLSRYKLWNSVILPPRNDEGPELSINGENYVYNDDEEVNAEVESSYSLVRKQGGYMPWSLKQSIKPAGILPKSSCLFNSEAPNSGVTNCQFTVKGWCNPRWIDSSSSSNSNE